MRPPASLLLILPLGMALAPRVAPAQPADACIKYWGEVRYGALAYNHVVHIANKCAADAECAVSTDVSPEPLSVKVAGKSTVEVTTFLGSPARAFTPHVTCTMHGR